MEITTPGSFSGFGGSDLVLISVVLVGLALLLLVSRELFCWYLKINQRLENQEREIYILKAIFYQLGGDVEQLEQDLGDRPETKKERQES